MQFEYNHKAGDPLVHVKFLPHKVTGSALASIIESLFRIGGEMQEDVSTWVFPMPIYAANISQIIANTCFQCGGLMQDDTQFVDLKIVNKKAVDKIQINVRRCSVCGHSHT